MDYREECVGGGVEVVRQNHFVDEGGENDVFCRYVWCDFLQTLVKWASWSNLEVSFFREEEDVFLPESCIMIKYR